MSIETILDSISQYDCPLVEITGGEPLLQKNLNPLISELIEKGYQVLIETNGSMPVKKLPGGCIKIIDIKCPSSNESDSFLIENLDYIHENDEIKFVIADRRDYDFSRSCILKNLTFMPADKIHLSPVFGRISPETIAEWLLKDNIRARLSLQQHKIIWDPEKRGV